MTPEEYAARLDRTIAQRCSFAKSTRTTWKRDADQFGFSHTTAVLLQGGGSLVLKEHLRYRRERPCRQVGGGLHVVRSGYSLIHRGGEFMRFDYDPHRHQDLPGAPFHKHVNDRRAIPIDTGDPRALDDFLAWAAAQVGAKRSR